MNNLDHQPSSRDKELTGGIVKRGLQILAMFIILGLVLFLSAGTFRWTAAWIYLGISLVIVVVNSYFMLRSSPETVAERGQAKGWKDWDKLVSGLFAVVQYLILPLVAGLDHRFFWSGEIGVIWHGAGALVYAISMALTSWAMISNAYFSTAARIQTDRGQMVCRSGPYRYLRHPGYVGIIIQSAGMAVLLGSWWALIPAIIAAGLMIIRTDMEDHMLQDELGGYQDYSREVKYRLLPGVW